MRFNEAKGRTSLPVERLRERFRDDDVLTVLPVSGDEGRRDSLLVATPRRLAVVTGDAGPRSDEHTTRWVPWDTVDVGAAAEPTSEAPPDDALAVRVAGRTFHASVADAVARDALGDFLVALEGRRTSLAL